MVKHPVVGCTVPGTWGWGWAGSPGRGWAWARRSWRGWGWAGRGCSPGGCTRSPGCWGCRGRWGTAPRCRTLGCPGGRFVGGEGRGGARWARRARWARWARWARCWCSAHRVVVGAGAGLVEVVVVEVSGLRRRVGHGGVPGAGAPRRPPALALAVARRHAAVVRRPAAVIERRLAAVHGRPGAGRAVHGGARGAVQGRPRVGGHAAPRLARVDHSNTPPGGVAWGWERGGGAG